ncbi:MAG: class I SAM-dependent methyltransferase [Rhodobacteraceae bacterium]|nr:class I SAM-dependent methyltransferase [Paracoccaceae bacterium]
MHLDVLDLRNFYYRTGLGRAAQRAVRDQVLRFWPRVDGQTVVGFGFAAPLLRPYLGRATRVICLMPGPQGVMPWPAGQPNVSVLCEETLWPLQNGQADRLVLLHGLETSENPSRLLEECKRVLAPSGKMLVVVPNRGGLWARRDKTPFGFGRPYSLGQLETQLKRHSFMPERHLGALFQPPSDKRFWLKTGALWEKTGRRISSGIAGGVLMVEASKQVYARPRGLPEAVKRPMRILEGIAKPEVKPV